jgi:hypothetical protein
MPITRNRIIYAGQDILISDYPSWENQTGTYSLKLLQRVQSSAISITTPVTRGKQLGSSDFAFEKYTTGPEVQFNLDYLLSDNSNELLLGFAATGNGGILSNLAVTGRDRNIFCLLHDEDGKDARSLTDMIGSDVMSLGNCYPTNYSVSAAIGEIPKASVSFDCLNAQFQTYNALSEVPAINLTGAAKSTSTYFLSGANLAASNYLSNQSSRAIALLPGNIELFLEQPIQGGIRYSGAVPASISSFQLNLPITRKDLVGFGNNFPYDKRIIFPLIGELSFNGTFDEPVTGDFSDIFINENKYDFAFNFKDENGATGIRFEILDAQLESQSFDLSIGGNLSFQSQFSFKVFKEDGLRISGAARLTDSLSA